MTAVESKPTDETPKEPSTKTKVALSEGKKAERRLGLLLVAPAAIVMLAVTAYPVGYAVWLSLQRYDLRFPALYRALALAGAQVMAIPAAFTRPTGEAHWEVLMRARAIETGSFVVAAAQGGFHEDGRGTWGHSLVVEPWGEVIAKLDHDEPGVLLADLDLGASVRARAAIPALVNARAFAGP